MDSNGIITQPLHNNYGGLLQNYALQQALKNMGHEVETIDWYPLQTNPFKSWVWECIQRLRHFLNKNVIIPSYQLSDKERARISIHTSRFISHYISLCPEKANVLDDFKRIDKKFCYDAYVVGSDQVWRPRYNPMLLAMFLDFVERKDVVRVAYAASFGTSKWEYSPELTNKCSLLASQFNTITVREKSGEVLCREYLGVDSTSVIDPTMLLDKVDYELLVDNEHAEKSKGDLFHYVLDPSNNIKDLINSVADKLGLTPFTVMPVFQAENRSKRDVKKHIDECVFPPVTSWLRGFIDARMVIVDSFHGAVFSIMFNKPFWVISNNKRGNARFESLLELFNLQERLISIHEGINVEWTKPIDWEDVNSVLLNEKKRCNDLLVSSLL